MKVNPQSHGSLTMQQILLRYGNKFRRQHRISYQAHKILNAIERCHTPRLGFHPIQCQTPDCHYEKIAYNSCRNRHCPACQSSQSARWVYERERELLPVPYFHVCFTLPHDLNPLVVANPKVLYDALFSAAWEAMDTLLRDAKTFCGQGGAIAVLHTWGQNLMPHPHVHMIVPGGALNKAEKQFRQRGVVRKKDGKKLRDFLVPVGPLRILFRNKFLSKLAHAYKSGLLLFPGQVSALASTEAFYAMKSILYSKTWVVYCKEPFAGPKQVLAYLGRYTHRVAISNSRLLSMEEGKVTFKLKNYKKGGQKEVMELPVDHFLNRFLYHALPKGYRRIRMFGFLSNRYKQKNLDQIRSLLPGAQANSEPLADGDGKEKREKPSVAEVVQRFFGVNILLCPKCGKSSLKLISSTKSGSS
jgi:hypothetical protein